jgi:hypothetical protein
MAPAISSTGGGLAAFQNRCNVLRPLIQNFAIFERPVSESALSGVRDEEVGALSTEAASSRTYAQNNSLTKNYNPVVCPIPVREITLPGPGQTLPVGRSGLIHTRRMVWRTKLAAGGLLNDL